MREWLVITIRWDKHAKVFVGQCDGLYSQGHTQEEAALATISAVNLYDATVADRKEDDER